MSFSRFSWYWHRLRAMSLAEVAAHARKRAFQLGSSRQWERQAVNLGEPCPFPRLPDPLAAPPVLRESYQRDVENILAGRWSLFGHLEIKLDDPPQWQMDYLAGKNLATLEWSFKLNHRNLPGGADIRVIWELSRWHSLVRLAQAAYVLADDRAAEKCVSWLEDWVIHNPPYRGWNWTSALEAGLRLLQFTWIDALLTSSAKTRGFGARLEQLRFKILPPHVQFTWRCRAFGSSANNHLLGELAGLIVATSRWPTLAPYGASLDTLCAALEREVLVQFAEDGGNREQALNYHLFAWELCWQARLALKAAGKVLTSPVEIRLARAARFYRDVQVKQECWDYGDSDNSFATVFFAAAETAVPEWCDWLSHSSTRAPLNYWLGDPPALEEPIGVAECAYPAALEDWWIFSQTGIALCKSGFWRLRLDLSPLGYLTTAAHGHLDAQHLSFWYRDVALIIDPGTGAYYGDEKLRAWLASRRAHNGPYPTDEEYPRRVGPFLWSEHHNRPTWRTRKDPETGTASFLCELSLPSGILRRCITRDQRANGWHVDDEFDSKPGLSNEFSVRWQFAPGTWVKHLGERAFCVNRSGASMQMKVSEGWSEVVLVEVKPEKTGAHAGSEELAGMVAPGFRKTVWAPYLKLTARSSRVGISARRQEPPAKDVKTDSPTREKPCVFRTTFLASGLS